MRSVELGAWSGEPGVAQLELDRWGGGGVSLEWGDWLVVAWPKKLDKGCKRLK